MRRYELCMYCDLASNKGRAQGLPRLVWNGPSKSRHLMAASSEEGGSRMSRLKATLERGNAMRKAAAGKPTYDRNTRLLPDESCEITLGSLMDGEKLSFEEVVSVMEQFRAEAASEPVGGKLPASAASKPSSDVGSGKPDVSSDSKKARPGALRIAPSVPLEGARRAKFADGNPKEITSSGSPSGEAPADEPTASLTKKEGKKGKATTATSSAVDEDEASPKKKKKSKRKPEEEEEAEEAPVAKASKKKNKRGSLDFAEPSSSKDVKSKRKEVAAAEEDLDAPVADDAATKQAAKKAKKALRRLEAKMQLEGEEDETVQGPAPAPTPSLKASERGYAAAEIKEMIDEIDAQMDDKEEPEEVLATTRRRHTKKRPPTPEASPEREVDDAAEAPQDGQGEQAGGSEIWGDEEWMEWWKFKGWGMDGWSGEKAAEEAWETWSHDRQPDFHVGWTLN